MFRRSAATTGAGLDDSEFVDVSTLDTADAVLAEADEMEWEEDAGVREQLEVGCLTPRRKHLCFNSLKVQCFQAFGFKYQPASLHRGGPGGAQAGGARQPGGGGAS